MMMLSLTSTLLLVDNDIDDIDNANDVNDVNADDADDKRRRKSSIEERKESRLDTSLDRVERLVMCCFFAPLAASQAEARKNNELFRERVDSHIQRFRVEHNTCRII
jgi:hypothetical protein